MPAPPGMAWSGGRPLQSRRDLWSPRPGLIIPGQKRFLLGVSRAAFFGAAGGGTPEPPAGPSLVDFQLTAHGTTDPSTTNIEGVDAAALYVLSIGSTGDIGFTAAGGDVDDTTAFIRADTVPGSFFHHRTYNVVSTRDANISVDLTLGRRRNVGFFGFDDAEIGATQGQTDFFTETTGVIPTVPSVTTTKAGSIVLGGLHIRGNHNLTTLNAALPSGWTLAGSVRSDGSSVPGSTALSTNIYIYKVIGSSGTASGDAVFTGGFDLATIGTTQVAWSGVALEIRTP